MYLTSSHFFLSQSVASGFQVDPMQKKHGLSQSKAPGRMAKSIFLFCICLTYIEAVFLPPPMCDDTARRSGSSQVRLSSKANCPTRLIERGTKLSPSPSPEALGSNPHPQRCSHCGQSSESSSLLLPESFTLLQTGSWLFWRQ